jgi:pyruvate dehydrogenase E1 component
MNENYAQPSTPAGDAQSVREGILKGIYPLAAREQREQREQGEQAGQAGQREQGEQAGQAEARVQLLGAGAILGEVIAAKQLLASDWGVEAAVWSVTSFTELHRDGMGAERNTRLGAATNPPYVTRALEGSQGPVIAATDYVRAVPELIRAYVPRRYVTLGTDGFGRSDTREALREFFEVDRKSIVIAALKALADDGTLDASVLEQARKRYRGDADARQAPWEC